MMGHYSSFDQWFGVNEFFVRLLLIHTTIMSGLIRSSFLFVERKFLIKLNNNNQLDEKLWLSAYYVIISRSKNYYTKTFGCLPEFFFLNKSFASLELNRMEWHRMRIFFFFLEKNHITLFASLILNITCYIYVCLCACDTSQPTPKVDLNLLDDKLNFF